MNIAIHYEVDIGLSLEDGILYFDGPLAYHGGWDRSSLPWFNEHERLKQLKSPPSIWTAACASKRFHPDIKVWLDLLLRYRLARQTKEHHSTLSMEWSCVYGTIQAFIGGHVGPWLRALRDMKIHCEAVVTQTYSLLFGEQACSIWDQIRKAVIRYSKPFIRFNRLPAYMWSLHNIPDLRMAMAHIFRVNGYEVVRGRSVYSQLSDGSVSSMDLTSTFA